MLSLRSPENGCACALKRVLLLKRTCGHEIRTHRSRAKRIAGDGAVRSAKLFSSYPYVIGNLRGDMMFWSKRAA
jgi:hypothetical protein